MDFAWAMHRLWQRARDSRRRGSGIDDFAPGFFRGIQFSTEDQSAGLDVVLQASTGRGLASPRRDFREGVRDARTGGPPIVVPLAPVVPTPPANPFPIAIAGRISCAVRRWRMFRDDGFIIGRGGRRRAIWGGWRKHTGGTPRGFRQRIHRNRTFPPTKWVGSPWSAGAKTSA